MTGDQLLAVARKDDPSWAVVTKPNFGGQYWVRDGRRWLLVHQIDGTVLAVHRIIEDWGTRDR